MLSKTLNCECHEIREITIGGLHGLETYQCSRRQSMSTYCLDCSYLTTRESSRYGGDLLLVIKPVITLFVPSFRSHREALSVPPPLAGIFLHHGKHGILCFALKTENQDNTSLRLYHHLPCRRQRRKTR